MPGTAPSSSRLTSSIEVEKSRAEHRPEDADRVDDGQLEAAALPLDEVPGGSLGERLRLRVGAQATAVGFVQSSSVYGRPGGSWP